MKGKNAERKLLSYMRSAVDSYGMIEAGDSIAVGVSGGKDSVTLLYGLARLKRFYPNPFSLTAVTLDMGFGDMDFSPIAALCEKLDIPFVLKKTDIGEIVFDIRKESNPCSLCAKMRRGALHDAAKTLGCNKIALGHHRDDAMETFWLNLTQEGRLGCFSPVTYLSRKDLTMIRPMLYASEAEVRAFCAALFLPIVKSKCPADKHTQREAAKEELKEMEKNHKDFKTLLFTAIQNSGIDGWKPAEKGVRNRMREKE